MISPSFGRSALHAVITRSLGSDRGSTTREWYRMPVTGLGIPSNSSSSSWITSHVFPSMSRSAHAREDVPGEPWGSRAVRGSAEDDTAEDQSHVHTICGVRVGKKKSHAESEPLL